MVESLRPEPLSLCLIENEKMVESLRPEPLSLCLNEKTISSLTATNNLLKTLVNAQTQAFNLLQTKVLIEENQSKIATKELNLNIKKLDQIESDEAKLMQDLMLQSNTSKRLKDAIQNANRVLKDMNSNEKKLEVMMHEKAVREMEIMVLNAKAIEVYNDIFAAHEEFREKSMYIIQNLIQILSKIKEKTKLVQEDIDYRLLEAEQEAQRLQLENHKALLKVNKVIPWLVEKSGQSVFWDVTLNVTIRKHTQTNSESDVFSQVYTKSPFSSISNTEITTLLLFVMSQPFGHGTFRSAYYAVDSKGSKYVVKHFHATGIDDHLCADHTAKAYFLSGLVGDCFTRDLKRIGINSTLVYVPSWYGWASKTQDRRNEHTSLFEGKALMIEPHIPSFQKWTNNVQWVAEGSEGELMSAYTHYSYFKSSKQFMVTDHQGHKEEKMNVGNGREELFVLTDPAIHVIPAQGTGLLILDEIVHPVDGNRRKDGVKEFASAHKCGPLCVSLGLLN